MRPVDQTMRMLVVPGEELPQTEQILRVLPVRACPPDVRVLIMPGDSRADAAAALRVIRHRLELQRAAGARTFAVTSARDGEGKSTFAVQLALVLSEARRARVLLVEAAFHRPALGRILGIDVPPGLGFSVQLARRMAGATEPWGVLALGPALHVLVENEAEAGFPATLHGIAFGQAIERLGSTYDWVIVDAPSVLGSGDANVVEEAVDGMILVARSRRSRGSDLRAAMAQLGERKAVGLVLWDAQSDGARSR